MGYGLLAHPKHEFLSVVTHWASFQVRTQMLRIVYFLLLLFCYYCYCLLGELEMIKIVYTVTNPAKQLGTKLPLKYLDLGRDLK